MKKYFKGHFFEIFLHLCIKTPVILFHLYKMKAHFVFKTCIPRKIHSCELIIYVCESQFIAEIERD